MADGFVFCLYGFQPDGGLRSSVREEVGDCVVAGLIAESLEGGFEVRESPAYIDVSVEL